MTELEARMYSIILHFGNASTKLLEQSIKRGWVDQENQNVYMTPEIRQLASVVEVATQLVCDMNERDKNENKPNHS